MVDQARPLGLDLGDAEAERIVAFESLLLDHAVRLGFVATADAARIRTRHILDCLRAVPVLRPGDRTAVDLGSGAGLPGVVVACAIPSLDVKLVEAHRRRAAFLELTVERLALENAQVLIEQVDAVDVVADICFSRAFAPLPAAWDACRRILRPGGRLVFFAGGSFQAETSLPDAGCEELLEAPLLESSGPLVIMTRQ